MTEFTSPSGHSAPRTVCVINPLGKRGEVTGCAELFEPCNDIEVGEWVAANINFADDTNKRLVQGVVHFKFREIVRYSGHYVDLVSNCGFVFYRLDIAAQGVFINFLHLVFISGPGTHSQQELGKQVNAYGAYPDIFHNRPCARAVE